MRVLITTDTVGGVWTFTQELTAGLLRTGCSVALVSMSGPQSAAKQTWCDLLRATYGNRFFYEALDIPLEWMQGNVSAYSASEPHLLRIATDFDAELLHSNQFCFGALPLDIPRIVTAHSDVMSWARACHRQALEASAWLRQYEELVAVGLQAADAVVAPTSTMLQGLEISFTVVGPTHVIPNGRSINPPRSLARALRAVTIGRLWDEAKDIALLRTVSSPIPLYIAGEIEHDGALLPTRECGEAHFLGPLAEEQVLNLFATSAIYICSSRYEPFGLAPLEAALCGCAVLARDIPTLREVWKDDALYFTDASSLSQLLHKLAADPLYLHQRQAQSYTRARQYSAARMTESYLALYRQLLAIQAAKSHAA